MSDRARPSAVVLYAPYLRQWDRYAGAWLLSWWWFALGGAVAATVVATRMLSDEWNTGLALFSACASLFTNFVKPWRFHRGFQRAAYKLRAALDRAILDPKHEAELPSVVDVCYALILDAGRDLDASDGLDSEDAPKTKRDSGGPGSAATRPDGDAGNPRPRDSEPR